MALSLSLYLSSMTGALINSAQVRQYAFSPLKNYMGECLLQFLQGSGFKLSNILD